MADRNASLAKSYSRWKRRRSLFREAKHLVKEARRILKRHAARIRPEVATEVGKAADALHEAVRSKRFAQARDRLEKLDGLVDKHLAFGRKSALREYTESIGVAVLIALLLRAFVVEAFKIPSGSMIPTLKIGDHIFVNKFVYGLRVPFTKVKFWELRKPKRGEVIVFIYPEDEDKDFIKRVVAVEGDTVEVVDGRVIVNGKPVSREDLGQGSYVDKQKANDTCENHRCQAFMERQDGTSYRVIHDLNANGSPKDKAAQKIPMGRVFVMGDNRYNSSDSREWGLVPLSYIKGRAMVIWWSRGEPDGIRWNRFFDLVHATPRREPPRIERRCPVDASSAVEDWDATDRADGPGPL